MNEERISVRLMVRLGEEGELEDACLTQSICAPLGFSPGAGKAGATELGRVRNCSTQSFGS